MLSMAGLIARERRDRGVMLNYPEAMALLSSWVIERARDGASLEQLMREGRSVLTRAELMEGVPEMLVEVQVEATFQGRSGLVHQRCWRFAAGQPPCWELESALRRAPVSSRQLPRRGRLLLPARGRPPHDRVGDGAATASVALAWPLLSDRSRGREPRQSPDRDRFAPDVTATVLDSEVIAMTAKAGTPQAKAPDHWFGPGRRRDNARPLLHRRERREQRPRPPSCSRPPQPARSPCGSRALLAADRALLSAHEP